MKHATVHQWAKKSNGTFHIQTINLQWWKLNFYSVALRLTCFYILVLLLSGVVLLLLNCVHMHTTVNVQVDQSCYFFFFMNVASLHC